MSIFDSVVGPITIRKDILSRISKQELREPLVEAVKIFVAKADNVKPLRDVQTTGLVIM